MNDALILIALGVVLLGYCMLCAAKKPENQTRGVIILCFGLLLLTICAAHLETLVAIKALGIKP
jgi:hypothetical protein